MCSAGSQGAGEDRVRECALSLADTADTYPSLLILQGIAEESDGATCIFVEGIKVC